MAREFDDDDDDLFASLGIISVPSTTPRSKLAATGAGAGANAGGDSGGAGSAGWAFGDGTELAPDLGLFAPPPLLWDEVKRNLRPAEVDEVAAVIGSDVIERNQALHREAEAFSQILHDFHSENEMMKDAVARRPKLGATRTHKMLGQQIRLLLSSIHDSGEAPSAASTPRLVATPRERAVVEFATGEEGGSSSPLGSARSRAASLSHASSFRAIGSPRRPSTSQTCQSAPDRLKPVMKKINAFNIDKIRDDFRVALDEECERLHDDINFLQSLLEEENKVRQDTTAQANAPSMPSVSDLRAYESKLQKVLSDKEQRERTEALLLSTTLPRGSGGAGPGSPARTPKLAPLRGGLVPSPPPGSSRRDAPSGGAGLAARGRSGRKLARTGSGKLRRGKPPVAPTTLPSPKRDLVPLPLGRGALGGGAVGNGGGVGGGGGGVGMGGTPTKLSHPPGVSDGNGASTTKKQMKKKSRVSRASRLRQQIDASRHLGV